MKRSTYSLFSLVVFMTLLSGCNSQSSTQEVEAKKDTAEVEQVVPSPAVKEEKEKTLVQLFMTDESAEEVVELQTELIWNNQSKYKTVFQALTSSHGNTAISLWEDWNLIDASIADGLLTLNLDGPEEGVGSSIERLMLLSLLKTMFQFSEVEKVQILIGGEKKETLSGHIDIFDPFIKQELSDL